ncbi:GIY-YIG nuclease family protein [Sunxiuqinia dokdonensis]|uniref:GIY-YIG nuclease family protein n=1 Tax=Sunxiuqinia dokdonensis TaxID=1409788 RepID=UPI0009E78674
MYYVYIIESLRDGSFYIGYTSNLEQRLHYHNTGKSRYTSRKSPWEIVWFERAATRSDAIRREKFLKRQRNRKFYRRLIDDFEKLKS